VEQAADLEIGLYRWDATSYAIDLRYTPPDGQDVVQPILSGPTVQLDLDQLGIQVLDPEAYGKTLSAGLFNTPKVQTAFAEACASAQALGVPLRVRLAISPSLPQLHNLRWEALRHPADGSWLLTQEQTLFSRFLVSPDFRPVRQRPKGSLQALVVIANPTDLTRWTVEGREPLAPVDVHGELQRARAALQGMTVTELAGPGQATLDKLLAGLRDGCDVLYLVAHGAMQRGEARLYLEKADGQVDLVVANELVTHLRELRELPRLAVLASCQSAGDGGVRTRDAGALSALGPRLAEAGVPAVLAMQGNVLMSSMATFLPALFKELQQHGEIDRAVAVARRAIADAQDSWKPALFLRLRNGKLWSDGGVPAEVFTRWGGLLDNLRDGVCTPVLGPGVAEGLLGSTRELARRWAETYRYPLSPGDRENLPQVAQYLAETQNKRFPGGELINYIHHELRRRFGPDLRQLPRWADPNVLRQAPLDDLISAVGQVLRQRDESEPHRLLARLPCPLYITANVHHLLEDALNEAGRPARQAVFNWQQDVPPTPDAGPKPTAEHPLVYHLFGALGQRDSLVLTEDDYFDYLINVTTHRDWIPVGVRSALADSALVFLGFQLDDWSFRVLFRHIMNQQGQALPKEYTHVAVQIDPESSRVLEPEPARRYLQQYFQGANIHIVWGRAEDFLKKWADEWQRQQAQDGAD
jgi:hypothetical protein